MPCLIILSFVVYFVARLRGQFLYTDITIIDARFFSFLYHGTAEITFMIDHS